MEKAEKVKVTFSHENGDELVCAFTWGEHVGIEIERTNGEGLFESTPLLQHMCCSLMDGLGLIKAEAEPWTAGGAEAEPRKGESKSKNENVVNHAVLTRRQHNKL